MGFFKEFLEKVLGEERETVTTLIGVTDEN